MGSPAIFSGRRTKLLTADGLLKSDGGIIDNDGIKNYIANGHAEVNANGWATYADAAGTSPVNGTGGSPSVTWTRSTTSPLSGQGSFLLTKGASNVQGEGASYDFTIDAKDKAKVLQISFSYLVSSGTFVAGTSSADSDVTVWLYDVTNSQLIQPSSYKLLSNSSDIADKFNATFQTASNSTSYRLILHVGSTSASAYTLKVDDVKVSTSTYVYGTPITDWQAYTPTITGAGTPTSVNFIWRRVGDSIQIQGTFVTGMVSATAASFTLPSGLTIDTTKLSSSAGSFFGDALRFNASATTRKRFKLQAFNGSTNLVYIVSDDYTTAASPASSVNGSTAWSNTETQSIQLSDLPILGWSSSVQMSDQTDTRVVVVNVIPTTPTGTINGSYNAVVWSAATKDTHGGYNGSTGRYTVAVPGHYRVSATLDILATLTAGQYIGVRVGNVTTGHYAYNFFKAQASVTSDYPVTATGTIYANAGDVLGVDSISSGSTLSFSSSLSNSFFAFERVSGPSAIAATESVNARYIMTGDQTGVNPNSSYVKINIDNKVFDSHGAFNTSSKRYYAPISGVYLVTCVIAIDSANVLNNLYAAVIYKNGSSYQIGQSVYQGAATAFYVTVTSHVSMSAGDYLEFYLLGLGNNSASTLTASSGGTSTSFSISRVGN